MFLTASSGDLKRGAWWKINTILMMFKSKKIEFSLIFYCLLIGICIFMYWRIKYVNMLNNIIVVYRFIYWNILGLEISWMMRELEFSDLAYLCIDILKTSSSFICSMLVSYNSFYYNLDISYTRLWFILPLGSGFHLSLSLWQHNLTHWKMNE